MELVLVLSQSSSDGELCNSVLLSAGGSGYRHCMRAGRGGEGREGDGIGIVAIKL